MVITCTEGISNTLSENPAILDRSFNFTPMPVSFLFVEEALCHSKWDEDGAVVLRSAAVKIPRTRNVCPVP